MKAATNGPNYVGAFEQVNTISCSVHHDFGPCIASLAAIAFWPRKKGAAALANGGRWTGRCFIMMLLSPLTKISSVFGNTIATMDGATTFSRPTNRKRKRKRIRRAAESDPIPNAYGCPPRSPPLCSPFFRLLGCGHGRVAKQKRFSQQRAHRFLANACPHTNDLSCGCRVRLIR
jgi:hypothetical protein